MTVPTICRTCGYTGIARSVYFGNSTEMTISGSETCPRCGGRAEFVAGTYDFVGTTISAFRPLGRDHLSKFKEVVEGVARGDLSAEDARAEADDIGAGLGDLLEAARKHGALGFLAWLIPIVLMVWIARGDDRNAEELVREVERLAATNERVLSELQRLNEAPNTTAPPPYSPSKPKPIRKTPSEHGGANRHERRKAAKLSRRSS